MRIIWGVRKAAVNLRNHGIFKMTLCALLYASIYLGGGFMRKKDDMVEEYDFSKGKRGPVISPKGKTRITIFIDTDILEWFRDEAEREGRGYQTEINQALRNYIKQDKRPIQDIVKEVVRKELKLIKKTS